MNKNEYDILKRQSVEDDQMAGLFVKELVRQGHKRGPDEVEFWSTIGWKVKKPTVTHVFNKDVVAAAIGHVFKFRNELKIKSRKTGNLETDAEFVLRLRVKISGLRTEAVVKLKRRAAAVKSKTRRNQN